VCAGIGVLLGVTVEACTVCVAVAEATVTVGVGEGAAYARCPAMASAMIATKGTSTAKAPNVTAFVAKRGKAILSSFRPRHRIPRGGMAGISADCLTNAGTKAMELGTK
jgi:hypothetical protein